MDVAAGSFLPVRVSTFDTLIEKGGVERGNTVLLSGGCGVGKTVFGLQSAYNSALNGEKSVYLTLTEEPDKIRRHAKLNFGWDIASMEEKNLMRIIKADPYELANDINAIVSTSEERRIMNIDQSDGPLSLLDSKRFKIPYKPDRIILDSLSALSSTFADRQNYRMCIQALIDALNKHDSVNFLLSETEQEPNNYVTTGVEEFLVDGVFAMYTIRRGQMRRNAVEIIKLRCSNHVREIVPYMITAEGIKIHVGEKIL